jgi:hypothetical protein
MFVGKRVLSVNAFLFTEATRGEHIYTSLLAAICELLCSPHIYNAIAFHFNI